MIRWLESFFWLRVGQVVVHGAAGGLRVLRAAAVPELRRPALAARAVVAQRVPMSVYGQPDLSWMLPAHIEPVFVLRKGLLGGRKGKGRTCGQVPGMESAAVRPMECGQKEEPAVASAAGADGAGLEVGHHMVQAPGGMDRRSGLWRRDHGSQRQTDGRQVIRKMICKLEYRREFWTDGSFGGRVCPQYGGGEDNCAEEIGSLEFLVDGRFRFVAVMRTVVEGEEGHRQRMTQLLNGFQQLILLADEASYLSSNNDVCMSVSIQDWSN